MHYKHVLQYDINYVIVCNKRGRGRVWNCMYAVCNSCLYGSRPCWASLSEPHINSTAVRELYMYIIMVRRSCEIIPYGSMDISTKYSNMHSHAWAMGRIYAVLI